MSKIADRELLRSTILNILLQMGEIEQTQADTLAANPDTNFDLVRVNFDSLTAIDFCLRIETGTGIVIDPGEMVELTALNELEAALMTKAQARREISS